MIFYRFFHIRFCQNCTDSRYIKRKIHFWKNAKISNMSSIPWAGINFEQLIFWMSVSFICLDSSCSEVFEADPLIKYFWHFDVKWKLPASESDVHFHNFEQIAIFKSLDFEICEAKFFKKLMCTSPYYSFIAWRLNTVIFDKILKDLLPFYLFPFPFY